METHFELARRAVHDLAEHSLMHSARPHAPVQAVRPSRVTVLRHALRRLAPWRPRLSSPGVHSPADRRTALPGCRAWGDEAALR